LWKQSAHAKLQQQPLAKKINNKLAALIKQSAQHMLVLEGVLSEATPFCSDLAESGYPQYRDDLVAAVLEAKPVSTIARLLVWLQQQPEMLGLHAWDDKDDAEVAAAACSSSGSSSSSVLVSYGRLWLISVRGRRAQD
jgi:hypothetical protein